MSYDLNKSMAEKYDYPSYKLQISDDEFTLIATTKKGKEDKKSVKVVTVYQGRKT